MEDGMEEEDYVEVKYMSGKKCLASELNKLWKSSQYSIHRYELADILRSCYKIFLPEERLIVKTPMKQ